MLKGSFCFHAGENKQGIRERRCVHESLELPTLDVERHLSRIHLSSFSFCFLSFLCFLLLWAAIGWLGCYLKYAGLLFPTDNLSLDAHTHHRETFHTSTVHLQAAWSKSSTISINRLISLVEAIIFHTNAEKSSCISNVSCRSGFSHT